MDLGYVDHDRECFDKTGPYPAAPKRRGGRQALSMGSSSFCQTRLCEFELRVVGNMLSSGLMDHAEHEHDSGCSNKTRLYPAALRMREDVKLWVWFLQNFVRQAVCIHF